MENENTAQQSVPIATTPAQAPVVEKKSVKLPWIVAGIVVLLIGVVIGLFILHPSRKNNSNSQPVTQNQATQNNSSLPQVSPINMASYPTVSLSALPLGDNKYTTTGPKKGYIYLCRVMTGGGGAQENGSWIGTTTWNAQEKPSVEGSVSWPNATFSNKISGSTRTFSGNGVPVGMTTGTFPISSTDPAYQYDKNPNSIKIQSLNLSLPTNPTVSSSPNCMGGEVGVMLDGVPLFNGFDAENRDAAAHEVQDACDAHPQEAGEYHYHSLSSCFKDIKESTVLGFALDGFPITGPVQSDGTYLTTDALDECHGITSSIILDGKQVTMYHYVMTRDFPYSVSCFKGKPVRLQVIVSGNLPGGSGSGSGQSPSQSGGVPAGGPMQNGQNPQPPQAAFTACSGKSTSTSCSFSGQKGTVSGTCQTPPGQSSVVCVPSGQNQGGPPAQGRSQP